MSDVMTKPFGWCKVVQFPFPFRYFVRFSTKEKKGWTPLYTMAQLKHLKDSL